MALLFAGTDTVVMPELFDVKIDADGFEVPGGGGYILKLKVQFAFAVPVIFLIIFIKPFWLLVAVTVNCAGAEISPLGFTTLILNTPGFVIYESGIITVILTSELFAA